MTEGPSLSIGLPCEICGADASWWVVGQVRSNVELTGMGMAPRCDDHGQIYQHPDPAPVPSADGSEPHDDGAPGTTA